MKKYIVGIIIGTFAFIMVACGANGPKGTYIDTTAGLMEVSFSGNSVSFSMDGSKNKGSYTMEGNTIICTFPDGNTVFEYNSDDNTLDWQGLGVIILERK